MSLLDAKELLGGHQGSLKDLDKYLLLTLVFVVLQAGTGHLQRPSRLWVG